MVRKSRLFALCGSLAFAGTFLALTACGSDSSTSSKEESVNVFDSKDDLPECSDSLGLDSAYVGADSALYVCADGKWTAADSSDTETSSSSDAKNSSGSKGSSSSANGSSSSAATSSSSDAPGTETLYVCEDHLNDISIKLYNDTLIFRYLEPVYRGPWLDVDKAKEQEYLNDFFTESANLVAEFKSYSKDELCDVSTALCALAAVDTGWEAVYDSSQRFGYSFRLPDTDKNRELVQSFRVETVNVEAAAFDNSDCVGGSVSYCRNSNSDSWRNMGIEYKYPEDTLVIGAYDNRLYFGYATLVSAYDEYFSLLIQDIEKAAAQGDVETIASRMGVEKDSPWMDLFKNGVRISVEFREYPNHSEVDVEMAVKGYDKKELAEAVLRAECSSSENFWLKRLIDASLFEDARDNQVYRMVQIGEQTWMAENLNYAYLQKTATLDSSSFCYKDSSEYCEKYGRLYMWSAAMDSLTTGCGYGVACSVGKKIQGVCPEGWHLPDTTEWNALTDYVAANTTEVGYALKSRSGWPEDSNGETGGSDAFGFSVLPAGNRAPSAFGPLEYAYIWTSTEDGEQKAKHLFLNTLTSDWRSYSANKYNALSVRCVKD